MKPFMPDPTCPKCGNAKLNMRHVLPALGGIDSLRMHCRTCSYSWFMKPADDQHTEEWGVAISVCDLAFFHDKTWRDQPEMYWLSRLMEEVGELAMALNDRHERDLPPDPDLELREIASICINWLEMRAQANDE